MSVVLFVFSFAGEMQKRLAQSQNKQILMCVIWEYQSIIYKKLNKWLSYKYKIYTCKKFNNEENSNMAKLFQRHLRNWIFINIFKKEKKEKRERKEGGKGEGEKERWRSGREGRVKGEWSPVVWKNEVPIVEITTSGGRVSPLSKIWVKFCTCIWRFKSDI